MKFRKSLGSLHLKHQNSHSMRKIQINDEDLKQCINYKQQAQSTKQSQNSILNKLLLQPPSMNNIKKLSLHQSNKKYQPKFQKPDVQNLIQENINLKNLIQTSQSTISNQKIKNAQLERKIKLLEKGLEKFQKNLFKVNDNIEKQNIFNQSDKNKKMKLDTQQEKKINTNSVFGKTGIVHTQILKKKVADLTLLYSSTQNDLKFIKKLPTATIYQQNDIQKQHLIAQTVRLKSIITSLSQQLNQCTHNQNNQKFQNQFMRMMKQQNQKLKATIRLLQNDKILLKSRQTIQNKLNTDLKKQIQHLKQKSLYKQSQLEKLNNENKNLLFKKTTQFRQEQQKKENEVIFELRQRNQLLQNEKVKLQESNDFYNEQNITLKEKQKLLSQQMSEIQSKYQKVIKSRDQQIQQLQFQLHSLKNDYLNVMNSGSVKKKKSIALGFNVNNNMNSTTKQSSGFNPLSTNNSTATTTNNTNTRIYTRSRQSGLISNQNVELLNQKYNLTKQKSYFKQTYYKPVKWQDVNFAMTHLYSIFVEEKIMSIDTFVNNIQEDNQVKCAQLISVFVEYPFELSRKQATKLARYIVEDSSVSANDKILFNQNGCITSSLAKTILLSGMQKIKQTCSQFYYRKWHAIMNKTKKLLSILKSQLSSRQIISKDQLIEMMQKYSRKKIQSDDYQFLIVKCFDKSHSRDDFYLNSEKIISILKDIMQSQYDDQQYV